MYAINGFHHYGSYPPLALAQDVPKDNAVYGNRELFEVDRSWHMGRPEIIARVHEDITIADDRTLTITLEHSNDKSNWQTLGTLCQKSGHLCRNDELDRFAVPSTSMQYIRAKIATDDPGANGKIDILYHYS